MNGKPIIVGLGEILWDLLPDGKKAGGAPINFVYHSSQLGADSFAISAIGKDALGDELLEEVKRIKINHLIQRVNYPTGTAEIELKNGIPKFTITEGVAWDYIPLTAQMEEVVKKAEAICFGTLAQRSPVSQHTILKLLSIAPKNSLRILDINFRQHYFSPETIEKSLNLSNVLKVNDEELVVLCKLFSRDGSEEEECRWFIDKFNLRMMILTAGANYSTIFTSGEISKISTPKTDVADTVGAGDAFTGALASSIIAGKTIKEAHRFAVETAAFVCTKAGAWPEYEL
ncbi:MAG: carbohydrate kinase [Bacteroidia bacterium]|nr:carbohydrate kinase [Bacteroidia bacterium]